MTRCAVLVLVLAACGGSSPKTAPGPGVTGGPGGAAETPDLIPTTKGPDCAAVADKLTTVVHAEAPDRQAEARDAFRIRCTDDKWSDEARNCMGTVETDAEVEGCAKLLTDAQRGKLGIQSEAQKEMSPKGDSGGPVNTRGGTRGRGQKTSSDPCEGGEAKADPCEGGE